LIVNKAKIIEFLDDAIVIALEMELWELFEKWGLWLLS